MNKTRMRLSEEDLAVVLKMRKLDSNPYKYVNSDSTYRLTLSSAEKDAVAIDRVCRTFRSSEQLVKAAQNALQYIFKDYDITVSIKNVHTGSINTASIFNG